MNDLPNLNHHEVGTLVRIETKKHDYKGLIEKYDNGCIVLNPAYRLDEIAAYIKSEDRYSAGREAIQTEEDYLRVYGTRQVFTIENIINIGEVKNYKPPSKSSTQITYYSNLEPI